MPKIFQMDPLPCLGDTIMSIEAEAMPPPPRKSFEEWVLTWIHALQKGSIHCPGCVDQERQAHKWLSNVLDIKSNRTPQEEEELTLHRQKLLFLNDVYDKVCKKAAEKRIADLQARLAANRAGRPLLVVPTVAPASRGQTAAVATEPYKLSAAEKDLYG